MNKFSKISLIAIVVMITSLGLNGQGIQQSNSWDLESNLLGFTVNSEQMLFNNFSLVKNVDFQIGGIWLCPEAYFNVALEGGARYYLPNSRSTANSYLTLRAVCDIAASNPNFNTPDIVSVRPMIGIGKNVSKNFKIEVSTGYDLRDRGFQYGQ